jgi:hypothetical protein
MMSGQHKPSIILIVFVAIGLLQLVAHTSRTRTVAARFS